MRSELQALDARYANRGTRIDSLLRDKERLWAQLSRRASEENSEAKCISSKQAAGGGEVREARQQHKPPRSTSVPVGAARPKPKVRETQCTEPEITDRQAKGKGRLGVDGDDKRK